MDDALWIRIYLHGSLHITERPKHTPDVFAFAVWFSLTLTSLRPGQEIHLPNRCRCAVLISFSCHHFG